MTEQELVALMSPQMQRGYWKAKEEALLEVYKVNWAHHHEYEKAQRDWNAENSTKWEAIRLSYDTKKDLIREQIRALQEMESQAFEDYKKAQDEIYHEQYQALKHVNEAQEPASNANQILRKQIETDLLAKYEERLREKGKVA